jgi:hypothetical protein
VERNAIAQVVPDSGRGAAAARWQLAWRGVSDGGMHDEFRLQLIKKKMTHLLNLINELSTNFSFKFKFNISYI